MQATDSSRQIHGPEDHVRLVNAEFGYGTPKLIPPTNRGYLYIAAAVRPGRLPMVLPNRTRAALLTNIKAACAPLKLIDGVVAVDVFRAIVRPPTARFSAYLQRRRDAARLVDFDVAVLVQTQSTAAARRVQSSRACVDLIDTVRRRAQRVYVMAAHQRMLHLTRRSAEMSALVQIAASCSARA
jgi:hypothetical protein